MSPTSSKEGYRGSRRRMAKAVFLDRDGVINKDPGGWTKYEYVTRWEDFHFLPGVFEALRKLNRSGMRTVVISNQAGVSKGFFSKKDLDEVTRRMTGDINKNGGNIEKVYYCIHKDEDNCNCRKPKAGLLETAKQELGIDLNNSYFIGDTRTDVMAGRLAGCRTIFVLSGKATEEDVKKWDEKPDYVFKDLLDAAGWLIKKEERKARRARDRD